MKNHVQVTIRELREKREQIDRIIHVLETMFGTGSPARPPAISPAARKPSSPAAPKKSATPIASGVTAAVREAIVTFSGEYSNSQISDIVRTKVPNVTSTQIAGAMSGLKKWGHVEMVRKDGPNPIWRNKG